MTLTTLGLCILAICALALFVARFLASSDDREK